ncbi:hypothetical protein [Amycolatopsis rhizosphaerae]|uniref:hypothetical protein n=1 Tax=Amycolatopsis rhizosphaerae TaxID=2053003 RepID=UPI001643CF84|nr:hypothetical protein [Amycolatopsis rhizosphaerae]
MSSVFGLCLPSGHLARRASESGGKGDHDARDQGWGGGRGGALRHDTTAPPRSNALGLGFFALGYLGLAFAHTLPIAITVLVLYGGFNACTEGVGKAWISTLVPAESQGSGQGIYQGATGAAILLAGIWAGLAWGSDGTLPLLISGSIAAVVAALMVVSRTRPLRPGRS